MNGNIAGAAWLDWVRRCRDILGVAVLLARLFGVRLDSGVLAEVGIGNEELVWMLAIPPIHAGVQTYVGIVGLIDHGPVNIINFDVLASDWVAHSPPVLALFWAGVLVGFCFIASFVVCQLGLDLRVSLPLVSVQVFHKLLNVRNTVLAGVVLPRRDDMLLNVHVDAACRYKVVLMTVLVQSK